MAETVNLRQVRKRKAREEAASKAADNRARFGQPKADRKLREAEASRAERAHDAHKLDKS